MYATWSYMTRGNVQRGEDAAAGPAERFLTTSSSLPLRPREVAESTPLMSLPSHRSPSFSSSSASTAASKERNTHIDQHGPANHNVGNPRKKKNKKGSNGASSTGKAGNPGKPKAICYEWNRRGTCEYGKACRYRHETPRKLENFRIRIPR
ncbi:hypothetical protein NUW58_g10901 [Xylaria curta]|uniref:Uncharacterized protein n=1 Tax=Xylaria curta TaxID=42375 RepID=A0ACC1MFA6_9PEZI|nr:hypothetical protein NUW58_g10901 [Xylaria curta]